MKHSITPIDVSPELAGEEARVHDPTTRIILETPGPVDRSMAGEEARVGDPRTQIIPFEGPAVRLGEPVGEEVRVGPQNPMNQIIPEMGPAGIGKEAEKSQ